MTTPFIRSQLAGTKNAPRPSVLDDGDLWGSVWLTFVRLDLT